MASIALDEALALRKAASSLWKAAYVLPIAAFGALKAACNALGAASVESVVALQAIEEAFVESEAAL